MTGIDLVKAAVHALDEKKAEDIEVIQITELSVVADYFVIANGTSNTHVRALAGEVEDALLKQGVEVGHIEGRATGWILLDYGSVVVHVFHKESREYYNLERLWADGKVVDIQDMLDR
ncbi:MAG TPA: ribosome silencing factor [Candidatus Fimivicinus intestinavium]|nr:ribosome silencing factor [Candidatus Fimivicinus intestinavium]